MIFKIITLFPEFFNDSLKIGLLGKALEKQLVSVEVIDLKNFSDDRFGRCDDYTFGGGSGMILKAPPIFKAVESLGQFNGRVVLTTPSGRPLTQEIVKEMASLPGLVIICGRYEGVDQRVIDTFVDEEISIGDYVLSGGEPAALVLLDAVSRMIPGFMSNEKSVTEESFENNLLEYPQYTRPADYRGLSVPDVLLSGNHRAIAEWRRQMSIEKTKRVRPDLLKQYINNQKRGE